MSKARCKNCKDVIESRYRHEFVTCTCYKKGQALLKAYDDKHYIIEYENYTLSSGDSRTFPKYNYDAMYADLVRKDIIDNLRGFHLDGGEDYCKFGGTVADIEWIPTPEPIKRRKLTEEGDV